MSRHNDFNYRMYSSRTWLEETDKPVAEPALLVAEVYELPGIFRKGKVRESVGHQGSLEYPKTPTMKQTQLENMRLEPDSDLTRPIEKNMSTGPSPHMKGWGGVLTDIFQQL
ncbi:predicted protein [Uncinocarpus reesii 1704]|uniref:Uncharacterized protein n=1 Tax=Uncinocarpus reesii (strain UAMH 1704) TaxID=336963 RepID=C4JP22_UNCRE|nr:uncharacterized protein UREG_03081 [Uncinocarpus reesii 1704]EEP78236.1 predicted protein [Uncinocarpus reesii 1704]